MEGTKRGQSQHIRCLSNNDETEETSKLQDFKYNCEGMLEYISSPAHPRPSRGEDAAELDRYSITEDFREPVTGMTISTFRDFPLQGAVHSWLGWV